MSDPQNRSSSPSRFAIPAVALLACVTGYWLWSGADLDEGGAGAQGGGEGPSALASDGSGLRAKRLMVSRDELLIAERAAVSGTVRDPEGAPLAGAQVCASPRSNTLLRGEVRDPFCTTTGSDGTYRLDGLFAVPHRLSASAPEHRPAEHWHGEGPRKRRTVQLMSGAERAGIDIVLKPGGVKIEGTVLDISGGVLEGALLRGDEVTTRSDEDGRFSLWVAPGELWVEASAEGYASGSDRGSAPGHDYELLLTPEAVIIGKVVIAGTETPVAGLNVNEDTHGARSTWDGPAALTAADGTFRIDGLDPGVYRPTAVDDEHYGVAAAQVRLGLGETSETVLIEVHPAFAITGSIIADDGEVCDRGSVSLTDPKSLREFSARTESDASVHLQGVLPGTYEVDVQCFGYVPEESYESLTIEEARAGLRWSVGVGQTIRGQVLTAGGEPAAEMRVSSTMKTDPKNPRARKTSTRGEETEADGSFALYGVKPGTHELSVSGAHPRPDAPVEVVVSAGSDVDGVKIELPPAGSVKGRVVDERGEPVGNVQLTLKSKDRGLSASLYGVNPASTRAADDGTFMFEHVRPGSYRAEASQNWMNKLRSPGTTDDDPQGAEVRVEEGELAEVEIRVEAKGASIRGKVVDADGGPITDAFLSATRESDSATKSKGSDLRGSRWGDWARRPVLTDQDGSFTLDDLTVGTYTVRARRKGGGEGIVEGVATGDDEVTVALEESGTIAGVVELAGGGTPEEFSIRIRDHSSGFRDGDRFFRTSGAFTFDEIPGGTYEVSVTAGEGSASAKISLEEGEALSDVRIELLPQVKLRGRLVDLESGEPIPGMQVMVEGRNGGGMFGGQGGERKEVSDANGEFEVDHAPSGEVQIFIYPAGDGTSDHPGSLVARRVPAEPRAQDLGSIELVKKRVPDQEKAGDLGYSLRKLDPAEIGRRVLKVGLVRPGGPAVKAGLKVGDVITSVNGHDVTGELSHRYPGLAQAKVGETVTLGLATGSSVELVVGPPL